MTLISILFLGGLKTLVNSDMEVLSRSLHLLPAVIFSSLPSSTTSSLTAGLVALAIFCLREIRSSSASACLLRYIAAHSLAVLAASSASLAVLVLNSLLQFVVGDAVMDEDRVTILEAVYRILFLIVNLNNRAFSCTVLAFGLLFGLAGLLSKHSLI